MSTPSAKQLPPDFYGLMTIEWATPAIRGLNLMHQAVMERFLGTLRYVELDSRNAHAFSYEYSSLLRDAASLFDSFSNQLCRAAAEHTDWKPTSKRTRLDIRDFREFYFRPGWPDWRRTFVDVSGLLPRGRLHPFSRWTSGSSPCWWEAHNSVKHSFLENRTSGSMGYALHALAAVEIVLRLISGHQFRHGFFHGVGEGWDPGQSEKTGVQLFIAEGALGLKAGVEAS